MHQPQSKCRGQIPSANVFPRDYSVAKHPCLKLTHLHTLMVSFTSRLWTQIKKILALVIPKSWHFTILVEAHDELGHQGVNRTYHLIKWQYY